MNLVLIALAPVLILLFYVYLRDKYDREPLGLLLRGLLLGVLITIPILLLETFLAAKNPFLGSAGTAWTAFVVAGFSEELFKFLALLFAFWKVKAFNERFDGIVYAVAVSLGFAGAENIMYVLDGGAEVGLLRAFTAVPAHATFGVIMGYYFGRAKMETEQRPVFLWLALCMPLFLHGMYDFLVMMQHVVLTILFFPFLFLIYRNGLRKMKYLSDHSVLRPGFGSKDKTMNEDELIQHRD